MRRRADRRGPRLDRRGLLAGLCAGGAAWLLGGSARGAQTETSSSGDELILQSIALNGVDPAYASRILAFYAVGLHDILAAQPAVSPDDFATQAVQLARLVASMHLSAGAVIRDGSVLAPGDEDPASPPGEIARLLHARRRDDGIRFDDRAVCAPGGGPVWVSPFNRPPVRPGWGEVTPFFAAASDVGAAPPPPDVHSTDVVQQLATMERDTRSISEQDRQLVQRYGFPTGTITPAGFWLLQADSYCVARRLPRADTHFIRALTMGALHDATIGCWRSKFTYWYPRPSQLNPAIRPTISVPNFPSFTSGHASMSGAASHVIGALLPGAARAAGVEAEAAARSRVIGGIHFEFDTETGLRQGRKAAEAAMLASRQATPGRTMLCELIRPGDRPEHIGSEAQACRPAA